MRKLPHIGGLAVGALAITVGAATPAPTARSVISQAPRPSSVSFTAVSPGHPLTLAHADAPGRVSFHPSLRVNSTNWAGYVATGSHTRFRYVQATFFVPYANCASTPNSYSSHWVGLDGASDDTVEQVGILAMCNGTAPVYTAWYETYPKLPTYPHIAVHPGDSVVASVYYSTHSRTFTLRLTDTTNGRHFARTLGCPPGSTCQRRSAEVISEAPSSGRAILPLANFRAEGYSGVRVTDQSGQRAGLRGRWWNTLCVTMVNGAGTAVLGQPTAIYHGTTFGTYWERPR